MRNKLRNGRSQQNLDMDNLLVKISNTALTHLESLLHEDTIDEDKDCMNYPK